MTFRVVFDIHDRVIVIGDKQEVDKVSVIRCTSTTILLQLSTRTRLSHELAFLRNDRGTDFLIDFHICQVCCVKKVNLCLLDRSLYNFANLRYGTVSPENLATVYLGQIRARLPYHPTSHEACLLPTQYLEVEGKQVVVQNTPVDTCGTSSARSFISGSALKEQI